jgi:hypothetical protein
VHEQLQNLHKVRVNGTSAAAVHAELGSNELGGTALVSSGESGKGWVGMLACAAHHGQRGRCR